jgi:allantoinase
MNSSMRAQTYVRGECVAADGKVLAEPGKGRFVSPLRAH